MFLLGQVGQTVDQLTAFERMFDRYGIGGAIIFAVVWFTFRYMPRLVEAHVSFVNGARDSLTKSTALHADQAVALEEFSRHVPGISRTNKAIRHGCELLDIWAHGHAHEKDIKDHVRAIRGALEEPV